MNSWPWVNVNCKADTMNRFFSQFCRRGRQKFRLDPVRTGRTERPTTSSPSEQGWQERTTGKCPGLHERLPQPPTPFRRIWRVGEVRERCQRSGQHAPGLTFLTQSFYNYSTRNLNCHCRKLEAICMNNGHYDEYKFDSTSFMHSKMTTKFKAHF